MKDLFCGAKVRLRAVERGDLPLIWQWQNDMEVMEHLWQRSVSQAELEREFERELADSDTVTRRFIVETLAGQPAGLIWFHNMNRLLVWSESTIADLHHTLQAVMEWHDAYLHHFLIQEALWDRAHWHLGLHGQSGPRSTPALQQAPEREIPLQVQLL